ncbi:MAG: two component transcriptional regulator, LuxR family [Verrucomicrobia bacterium]|nr:two component transcriptional regulator, LuxR family [Verrucomicrobiota bacterium]
MKSKAPGVIDPPKSAPKKSAKTRILLVDDHPLLRRGMRALLEQQPRFEVCAEADSAPVALEMVRKWTPDLTIVDISLKSTNGIELTKGLKVEAPNMPVLVVSMHDEELYAERALRAGAVGYLMKHEAGEKIITALDRILEGEIYVSDRLKEKMLHRFVNHRTEKIVSVIDTLSDREMEVLQLLGNGFGTRAIASQLKLSVKTIDSYREHLKVKLALKSGADLVRYAIQWMKSQAIM